MKALTFPVSNTGNRDSVEVVQVYVRKANDNEAHTKLKSLSTGEHRCGQNQSASKMQVTPGEYEL